MAKKAWFRKSSPTSTERQCFSDIENTMIEEAFEEKRPFVELDDYTIDFGQQVARTNDNKTYGVEHRTVNSHNREQYGYQQRFTIAEQPRFRSFDPFSHEDHSLIWKWMLKYDLRPTGPHGITDTQYAWILNQAAAGIIIEGAEFNRNKEATWIASKLQDVRDAGVDRILIRVVFLYTCESFLYKLLNQQLLAQETSKCATLGPFAYLLWLSFNVSTFHKQSYKQTIYRGLYLDENMIQQYRDATGKGPCTWSGFTSASKSRSLAESYGNTLLIMEFDSVKPPNFEAIDISSFSSFSHEEEVLLPERNCFRVDRVERCRTGKTIIYITICDPYSFE